MKRFAFAAVLLAAFMSTLAQSQTVDLRATIPFTFRVGATEMPAGEYLLHRVGGAFVLREQHSNHAALIALTRSEYRSGRYEPGELEFNRYGETYFLSKVWPPASATGIGLPKTPRETELARQFNLIQRANVTIASK